MSRKIVEKRFQLPERSDNWLITFGDLLTLLVCFFISAWATVRIRQQEQINVTTQDHERISHIESSSTKISTHGTPIAQQKIGNSPELLRLGMKDFRGSPERLNSEALERLVKLALYRDYRWNLEVCSTAQEGSGIERWRSSERRAFYLRGQLIGAGLDPERIGVRALGTNCKEMFGNGIGEDGGMVAVVYPEKADRN